MASIGGTLTHVRAMLLTKMPRVPHAVAKGAPAAPNTNSIQTRRGPLWVKSGSHALKFGCLLHLPKADLAGRHELARRKRGLYLGHA